MFSLSHWPVMRQHYRRPISGQRKESRQGTIHLYNMNNSVPAWHIYLLCFISNVYVFIYLKKKSFVKKKMKIVITKPTELIDKVSSWLKFQPVLQCLKFSVSNKFYEYQNTTRYGRVIRYQVILSFSKRKIKWQEWITTYDNNWTLFWIVDRIRQIIKFCVIDGSLSLLLLPVRIQERSEIISNFGTSKPPT